MALRIVTAVTAHLTPQVLLLQLVAICVSPHPLGLFLQLFLVQRRTALIVLESVLQDQALPILLLPVLVVLMDLLAANAVRLLS